MTELHLLVPADIPPKPAPGAPCNGCGVCCLAQTCPVGWLLSGRRAGPCSVLRWDADQRRYWCGALREPAQVVAARMGRWGAPWHDTLGRALGAVARHGIGAGLGCDCSLEVAHETTCTENPAR